MSVEAFQTFTTSLTTYENAILLNDSVDLLDSIGYVSHQEDLERIMMTSENHENIDNLTDLFQVLTNYVIEGVGEFGVTLTTETTLGDGTEILKGLQTIENYGDPEHLYHKFNDDINDNIDILSEILSIVCVMRVHEIEVCIEEVRDTLIDSIRSLVFKRLETEPELKELDQEKRRRFLEFADKASDLWALTSLREGVRFKTPIDTLLMEYEDDLLENVHKPQTFSEQLLGLVLLSDVERKDEVDAIKMLLDEYVEDINATSTIFRLMTQHLKELE